MYFFVLLVLLIVSLKVLLNTCMINSSNLHRTHPYLLRSATNEGLGVQYAVQLPQNGGKVGVFLDPFQQVIITALLFDHGCCLLGQDADLLVAVLTGAGGRSQPRLRRAGSPSHYERSSHTCLLPPAFTMAMMMFSVAMKGSSWRMCLSMTLG